MKRIDIPKAVAIYRKIFEENGVPKEKFDEAKKHNPVAGKEDLSHCHALLDDIMTYYDKGWLAEAGYWLGFIGGIKWKKGVKLETINSYISSLKTKTSEGT